MKEKVIRLPKDFKKYFWDVDFKKLSFSKYPNSILERLMRLGDMTAVRWLLTTINKKMLRSYVLKHGDRQLDRISNNFWRIYLGLPPSKKPVNSIWPY